MFTVETATVKSRRAPRDVRHTHRLAMILRAALLCATLALEIVFAVLWDFFDEALLEELLALGACVLVGTAFVVRCCCCRPQAMASSPSRWATLIALLLTVLQVKA